MQLPPFHKTIQSVWRLKGSVSFLFFILVNIIFIGLIAYGLIHSDTLTGDEKKNISYAEIALSFVGSFPVLLLFGFFSIGALYVILTRFTSKPLYAFLFMAPVFLLLNQFSLTGLRLLLQGTLSEQQQTIITGITIPVTLFISYLTIHVFDGTFMD
jgi:hypothetical protein